MKIKLHLLRQAHALKTHGSFSRAAAALNLSQPALSQGIKELEAQVGLQTEQPWAHEITRKSTQP